MDNSNKITKTFGAIAKSYLGFGNFASAEVISSANYRSGGSAFGSSGWLFDNAGIGGLDVHFSFNGLDSIVKAYECCPPVYSIINKQALAFTNGKVVINDNKGKESNSNFAKKLKTLLKNPNQLQNWKQFEAQATVYIRLFGYCIILPIKPVGFEVSDATALWIIPPYMCEIKTSKQTFYNLKKGYISSITIKYGQEESALNPDDVIILRDITPGFETLFLPNSPIKPIQQNISNVMGIYQSKGVLINYRGALGILTPEAKTGDYGPLEMDPKEKEQLQQELLGYGLRAGQWKYIVTTSSLKWQQMGIKYSDLMLTEWAEDDMMVISDALNYPYKLLANSKASSMNGTETAQYQRILYQDFVIPFAEMIYEQLSAFFECDKYGVKIEKDFSHITVIQDDKLNAGRALLYANNGAQTAFVNNALTLNEWRKLIEQDPIDNGDGDKFYFQLIAEGKTFGTATPAPIKATTETTQSNG